MIIQHNNTVLNFNVVTFLAKVINLSRLYHHSSPEVFPYQQVEVNRESPFAVFYFLLLSRQHLAIRKNIYKTIIKDYCLLILIFRFYCYE